MLKTVIPLIFFAILGILLLGNRKPVKNQATPASIKVVEAEPSSKMSEVHSSDGSMKLVMKKEISSNQASYLFSSSDIVGKNSLTIFTETLATDSALLLPPNSWSPDNKFLYIEKRTSQSFNTFVFKARGGSFAKDEEYLDVGSLLVKSKPTYQLTNATGWVSPTLLQVEAQKENGSKTSYWFSVETSGFLLFRD